VSYEQFLRLLATCSYRRWARSDSRQHVQWQHERRPVPRPADAARKIRLRDLPPRGAWHSGIAITSETYLHLLDDLKRDKSDRLDAYLDGVFDHPPAADSEAS